MAKTVKIGKSDVVSTPLGLGTNKVGGHNLFPNLIDEQGAEVVRRRWITAFKCWIRPLCTGWAGPKRSSAT